MGRQDTFVWRYFTKEKKENCKYLIARCRFCRTDYLTNARRMRKHILRCPKSPEEAKAAIQKIIPLEEASTLNRSGLVVSSSKKNSERSQNILNHLEIGPAKEKQVLDSLLARAFYSSGVPFQLIDNQYFQEFIARLRPFYDLPSRRQLATTLLEKEYQLIDKVAKSEFDKADSVTLMADSWTNANGNSSVNILVAAPKPIFIKTIDLGGNANTGQHISEMLVNVIEEIGAEKVSSVITDNAANMKLALAWKKVEDTFPHMQFFGCAAHGLNLLTEEILSLPFVSSLVESSKKVIEFFTSRQVPKKVLANKQRQIYLETINLVTVVETWWPSVNDSLKSLLDSKESLQAAAVDNRVAPIILPDIRELLSDEENFWDNISNLSQMLEPICALINALQSDSPQLSCVVPGLKDIQVLLESSINFLDNEDQETVLNVFKTRRKLILCDIHWVATQLDPRLKTCLSQEEEKIASSHILKLSESYGLDRTKIVKDLKDFKERSGLWKNKKIWNVAEKRGAKLWWKTLCGKTELSKLAIKILDIPATSTSSLKDFTTFSHITTKKNNRIAVSKIDKLQSVMFNLKLDNLYLNPSEENSEETVPNNEEDHEEEEANRERGVDKLVALLEGSAESDIASSNEDDEGSSKIAIPTKQEPKPVLHSRARKR